MFSGDSPDGVDACGVMGCPCEGFKVRAATMNSFRFARLQICTCGHKRCTHAESRRPSKSALSEVPFPSYWNSHVGSFSNLVPVGESTLQLFQKLFDATYKDTWTRDRQKHNPTHHHVPKGYRVTRAWRAETSKYWKESESTRRPCQAFFRNPQEYCIRRAELLSECTRADSEDACVEYKDVKSTNAWAAFADGTASDRLKSSCNEWYLFHGTNEQAALTICKGDFKMCLAGSSTGTLYGRGSYFAESITKADEYAKSNAAGEYTVMLCRVLGGKVYYTDELVPDPEELTNCCIQGPYDCILGDREKCRNTYREFVVYDSENVYAEYVINYLREV
eukprot:gnl/TRDRNA2_/TRDRNA2_176505_c3_seq20.p1 gnl/TRDRNA2_/TRDRNA2_176505_c3~~gnl/TRDRNA2_/TRDRNA2_176505_c3_seq20.p1  ORF type:complete len:335 (+),score=40.56 gnl/TRDRNA2_/TRDRNA2_176505_c3_seq20:1788-2792(+)